MPGLHIAVDGKTARGSARRGLAAVHIVRAFAVNHSLVLGQLATEAKSNEITAIPELLDALALSGALVSLDAMGTQHAIADTILERGGDYLLAVKGNQPTLHAERQDALGARQAPTRPSARFFEQEEEGHGRIERRRVWTETKLARLDACQAWSAVAMVVRVESLRTAEGKTSVDDRYYLCNRVMTAKEVAATIRGHWAIENTCHWSLDVTLGEDASRIAEGYGAENVSLARSVVLAALKRSVGKLSKFGTKKLSLVMTQKVCSWDKDTMLEVAGGLFSAC